MLITRHFLVLNVPKSGSSFVRAAIKAVYAHRRAAMRARGWLPWGGGRADRSLRELILPNIRLPGRPKDQHGTAAQIPRRFRTRAIVSVLRNPYEKAVSEYRFRWWARFPPLPPARLASHFPRFPALSFDDFLRLADLVAARKMAAGKGTGAGPARIGNLTVEFIQFFFRDPAGVLQRLDDDYVGSGAFRADMNDVRFLRQEVLADDLAALLEEHGFAADEVALCRAHDPVNVTPDDTPGTDGAPGNVRWTREGLVHFENRERYLFAMLAALGFRYAPPATDLPPDAG